MAGGAARKATRQLSLTLKGGVSTRGKGAQEGGSSEARPIIQQEQGGAPCEEATVQELVKGADNIAPSEREEVMDQQKELMYDSMEDYMKDLEEVLREVPRADLLSLMDTMKRVARANATKTEDLPEMGAGLAIAQGPDGVEAVQPKQDQNMASKGERSRLRSPCLQSCD